MAILDTELIPQMLPPPHFITRGNCDYCVLNVILAVRADNRSWELGVERSVGADIWVWRVFRRTNIHWRNSCGNHVLVLPIIWYAWCPGNLIPHTPLQEVCEGRIVLFVSSEQCRYSVVFTARLNFFGGNYISRAEPVNGLQGAKVSRVELLCM
ncbi:hypothetical protein BO83DRAFT_91312 [Aspergillus eucalypticola CBS 122712]|uniref:Uncharacterized protein n=1 Tax=Aspergillus eucalypticola (strain CBS 122712 / IBT 29274) TaxID=1448314 RepID=A0A317V615_ASPEC|nr:uncharacterized protein BO83DRAFT_91312 [Aspergillus eucalypticola CBS 122712]PWY68332.1 hypothetical protein BO83DRAFT_91312 [Aspergillus eucalypticola CBS 122712]